MERVLIRLTVLTAAVQGDLLATDAKQVTDKFALFLMNSFKRKNSLFPFLTVRVRLLQMSMNATVTRV